MHLNGKAPVHTGRARRLAALTATLLLGGCQLATPFRGPDLALATQDATAVVAITHVVFNDDRAAREHFWDGVAQVEASLDGRPGFLGFSKRTRLLGGEAWTMTAWADQASLQAFVTSPAHQAAMATGYAALAEARFARVSLARNALPLDWTTALDLLDREGRRIGPNTGNPARP